MSELNYDLCINYNKKDIKNVESLASEISDNGLRIWFDKWELVPGEGWQVNVVDALSRSAGIAICPIRNRDFRFKHNHDEPLTYV